MQQGSYNGQAFGRKYLVFKDASCGVASGISGMKWKDVCRPKECGGLGAKDLRLFDMARVGVFFRMRNPCEKMCFRERYRDGVLSNPCID
jgi:hypothetical protein